MCDCQHYETRVMYMRKIQRVIACISEQHPVGRQVAVPIGLVSKEIQIVTSNLMMSSTNSSSDVSPPGIARRKRWCHRTRYC